MALPPPFAPFVARAAAANVNPRTRLSHVTEIPSLLGSSLVHARTMPSDDAKFLELPAGDSQDFAASSRISKDSDDAQGSSTPPPTPLKPGACPTEAPLQPRA